MQVTPVYGTEIVTAIELKSLLHQQWPELDQRNVFFSDNKFVLMTENELLKIIENRPLDKYKFIKQAFDCDDYSLLLQAHVIIQRYIKITGNEAEPLLPWAFGQIWYKIGDSYHTLNICVTSGRKIRVIEPQLSKPSLLRDDFEITFIRF